MERFFRLQIPRRNIDGDFEVTSFQIDLSTMSCIIGVRSASSAAYDFDAASEEGPALSPPDTGSGNPTVPAPSAPTGVTAFNSSGTVTISFVSPNDTNVYACRVWRGTSTFGASTDISGPMYCSASQLLAWSDAPGSGTWKYWATAESVSGNSSAESGPATVVV